MTVKAAEHALLAPSSAHIWAYCAASVNLQAQYPEPEDSEEAREGTAAHWYVSELLYGRDVAAGSVAPNGEPITAEMIDCAQGILVDIRDTYATCVSQGGAPLMYVEARQNMDRLVHPENWGTPDVVIIDAPRKKLFVWDYKYGHRYVDAAENLQLIDYAIGALREIPSLDWPHWSVCLNIAQPRNYHRLGPMREWQTTGRALLDEYVPQLHEAAKLATGENPAYQTGDYCRDCSARYACPALQQAAALAMDVAMQAAPPIDLPPHALGLELRQLDDALTRIKARKTGLEEQALGAIRSGQAVPFFSAQHSVGRERWNVPAAEAFALGEMFGVDLKKPPEPITPKQARDLGVDETVMLEYAGKPRGALRLERADDNAAKLAFE